MDGKSAKHNTYMDDASHQITILLTDWSRGDELAVEQLMPLVYEELRRMAKSYMRSQPSGHTFRQRS